MQSSRNLRPCINSAESTDTRSISLTGSVLDLTVV
jgi:hypothetical protein